MKRLIFLFALLLGLDSHGGFYDKLFVNWHNQSSASMWTAFYEQYNVNPQADAGGVSANYTLTSAPLVQFIYGSSPWTVTLSWYSDPALTQLRQQTTVTVNSPGPSGTNMSVDMYWTGMVIDDPSDGLPKTSNRLQKTARDPNCGMPGWEVSEPYVSLWLHDEPLGYQPALGPHVSFELAYKQREFTSGFDPNIFSIGKKWNCSWLSYVAQDANMSNVVHFAGGGQRTFYGTNDFFTNTRLSGDTANGFILSYPDGSQDVYGFMVTNNSGAFQKAFMTSRWNAQGQRMLLNYASYSPSAPVVRLQNIVDGDGRTNFIYYTANAFSTNLISQVVDGFGRTSSLLYDTTGHLTTITDVAGLSSSFAYDTNDWVTSMTTPYGTTSFMITDKNGANIPGSAPNGRSILVTEADGGQELFLYQDNAPGVASTYSPSEVPSSSPFANTFDNADLNIRNTFHWGRLQYSHLSSGFISTTNTSALTNSDFLISHMRHWLKADAATTAQILSLERDPSPDGANEGQKTWYDYAGKTNPNYIGTQVSPLFIAKVLPDGTTLFERTDRNSIGNVLTNVSTYSIGANVFLRTNIYAYATDGIDLITVTNALLTQVSSNAYNLYHQVTNYFDALNQKTVYTYSVNQELSGITRPTGLITTNYYNGSNQLTQIIDFAVSGTNTIFYRTNAFTYGANGLVYTQTDERGLTISNYWDNLQRLTGRLYPDGTTTSNLYYRLDGQSYPNSSGGTNLLDLTATKDRLGDWTYFTYDAMRRKVYETNALNTVTAYGYCQCGALESITYALNTPVQQTINYTYDKQGNTTVISERT